MCVEGVSWHLDCAINLSVCVFFTGLCIKSCLLACALCAFHSPVSLVYRTEHHKTCSKNRTVLQINPSLLQDKLVFQWCLQPTKTSVWLEASGIKLLKKLGVFGHVHSIIWWCKNWVISQGAKEWHCLQHATAQWSCLGASKGLAWQP